MPEGWKENNLSYRLARKLPLGLKNDLPGDYLLAALMELGPINPETGGIVSWSEIHAYASATGAVTQGWEKKALRDLSGDYRSAREEGKSPLCIPPVDREKAPK